MLQKIVNTQIALKVARRVLPVRLRQKLSATTVLAPDEKHFREMLRDRAAAKPVSGRVVLVCGSLQPGGAERQVANTLVGLAPVLGSENLTLLCDHLRSGSSERHDFYLPLARTSDAVIREIRKDVATTCSLPESFLRASKHLHPGLVSDVAALYREFCVLRPALVHAWLDWSNVRAGLAAVLAGVPRVLLSGRNLSPRHFALNTNYFYPAYRALSDLGRKQIVWLNNSQAGADDYADWLSMPPERIQVVRNGVQFSEDVRPTPERCAELRALWGVPVDVPLIGGMFRFNEEKRPLLWIQTAAHLAQALPNAHFAIFGQGPMRSEMEALIRRLKMRERIHLPGLIAPSLEGLAPCDLVLLTSRGEGTPNVLLEAQWLGLPVVAVDAGGAREAVKEGVTGLVVKSDRADDIAAAILNILEDKAFRSRARQQGGAFVLQSYGINRMVKEMIETYGLSTASVPLHSDGNRVD